MDAQTLTPTQIANRHSIELERLGHMLAPDGHSKRVALTGIAVARAGTAAETLVLRLADAADVVPFTVKLSELSDPVRNHWRTPLHQALHGMPIKFTFPHQG